MLEIDLDWVDDYFDAIVFPLLTCDDVHYELNDCVLYQDNRVNCDVDWVSRSGDIWRFDGWYL